MTRISLFVDRHKKTRLNEYESVGDLSLLNMKGKHQIFSGKALADQIDAVAFPIARNAECKSVCRYAGRPVKPAPGRSRAAAPARPDAGSSVVRQSQVDAGDFPTRGENPPAATRPRGFVVRTRLSRPDYRDDRSARLN